MINETAINVQTVSDPNLIFVTWALVIATIVGVGITTYLTRESLKHTQESNVITERMLELTHRPILKLNYVTPWWEYKKGDTCKTYDMIDSSATTKKFPIAIHFQLINTGVESAQDIIASYGMDFINSNDEPVDLTTYKNKFTTSKKTIDDLKSKFFDLDLPASHTEDYKINDELEVRASTKCIFTFEISYTFLGNSEGYIQYIYEYTQQGMKVLFRSHSS